MMKMNTFEVASISAHLTTVRINHPVHCSLIITNFTERFKVIQSENLKFSNSSDKI